MKKQNIEKITANPIINELKITVLGRPVPAVRTTQMKKFIDPNYKRYNIYKKRIAAYIEGAMLAQLGKCIQIPEKVPVTLSDIIITTGKGRDGDLDNYLKSIMDSIQLSGIVKNDTQIKCVTNIRVERSKLITKEDGNAGTVIELSIIKPE